MRVTYRHHDSQVYWASRWAKTEADAPMENRDVYPLKYALEAISRSAAVTKEGVICEAGCGNGRLVRYFMRQGYAIKGFDFIPEAIDKIKEIEPEADVEIGDILKLSYPDTSFDAFLAFGLYHSLPWDLQDQAFRETWRVMKPGAILCASFRADNICNRMLDFLREREEGKGEAMKDKFHKLNLTRGEYTKLLSDHGFNVEKLDYVVNMPLLYKFACFRHASHKVFEEHKGRCEGYLLNAAGRVLWKNFMRLFPAQACNVFVAMARKA